MFEVALTYRLRDGITATFTLRHPSLDDVEDAVSEARNVLDGVVGSALDNADVTQVVVTEITDEE